MTKAGVVGPGPQVSEHRLQVVSVNQLGHPGEIETQAVAVGQGTYRSHVWYPLTETNRLAASSKYRSKPAGEMISIIRAGSGPAFHMEWTSLRGLVIYPPGPREISLSPDRNPISPSPVLWNLNRVLRLGAVCNRITG